MLEACSQMPQHVVCRSGCLSSASRSLSTPRLIPPRSGKSSARVEKRHTEVAQGPRNPASATTCSSTCYSHKDKDSVDKIVGELKAMAALRCGNFFLTGSKCIHSAGSRLANRHIFDSLDASRKVICVFFAKITWYRKFARRNTTSRISATANLPMACYSPFICTADLPSLDEALSNAKTFGRGDRTKIVNSVGRILSSNCEGLLGFRSPTGAASRRAATATPRSRSWPGSSAYPRCIRGSPPRDRQEAVTGRRSASAARVPACRG